MKKLWKVFLLVLLMFSSLQLVQANETYIIDTYDQFNEEEESYYNQLAQLFDDQYDMDVMLVNLETTSGDPDVYATDAYQTHCDNANAIIIAYTDDYYLVRPYGTGISIVSDEIWTTYYQSDLSNEQRFHALFVKLEELMKGTESKDEEIVPGLYFSDEAQLLSEDQAQELNQKFEKASEKLGIDVIGLTTVNLDGMDAENYAREYYRSHDYAEEGIILMMDIEDRMWALVAMDQAISMYPTRVRDNMSEEFVPYLSDGDYQEAFENYLMNVEYYHHIYKTSGSENYEDALDAERFEANKGYYFLVGSGIGLVVGLIIALLVRSALISQCRMVKPEYAAQEYLVRNSMKMRQSQDYFLYRNLIRTPRPKDDDRSSSSSSSSSHDSGGSSGRF